MQIFILAIGVLLFVFYHFEQPPLIFNPAEEAQVRQSSQGPAYEQLEKDYRDLHSFRREATLDLLRTRREGGDPAPGRSQIRQYHAEMEQVRGRSKELVETVQGRSSTDVNYVFPSYLVQYVPAGILGLMIAVIFAAAMSSLDSELTALSSATVMDFYRRYLVRGASVRTALSLGGPVRDAGLGHPGHGGRALRGPAGGVPPGIGQQGGLVFLRFAAGSLPAGLPGPLGHRPGRVLGG